VLWSTGFFSNLKIEGEEGSAGKVVKITVEENPVIKAITYKQGKRSKRTISSTSSKRRTSMSCRILTTARPRSRRSRRPSWTSSSKRDSTPPTSMFQTERKGKNEVESLFKIDEGPKVRVGEVIFAGRPKIPQSELQLAMKSNRPHQPLQLGCGEGRFTREQDPGRPGQHQGQVPGTRVHGSHPSTRRESRR